MLVTITGPVHVTRVPGGSIVDDARDLQSLDGWSYQEDGCANYVHHDALTDVDLQGGDIRLAWDAKRKRLNVVTSYRVSAKLKPKQIAALRDETLGQWTDGVGSDCFAKESKKHGVKLRFGIDPKEVEVTQQEEKAASAAKPTRVTIFGAIKRGSLDGVRKAIAAAEDLETVRQHQTPLLAAVESGNLDIIRVLLDAGANARATGVDRATALHSVAAIRKEFVSDAAAASIVELLAARGADLMAVDEFGQTPLELALNRKKSSTAQALRTLGAQLFTQTVSFLDPQGRPKAVEFMYGHKSAQSRKPGLAKRDGEGKLENLVPGLYTMKAITDGVRIEPGDFKVLDSGVIEPSTFTCHDDS